MLTDKVLGLQVAGNEGEAAWFKDPDGNILSIVSG